MNISYLLSKCASFLKLARLEFDATTSKEMMRAVKHCIGVRYIKEVEDGVVDIDEEDKKSFLDKCNSFLSPEYNYLNSKLSRVNHFWWSKHTVKTWDQPNLVVLFNEQGKKEKSVSTSMKDAAALFDQKLGGVIYVDISEPKAQTPEELDMLALYNQQSINHELRHLKQFQYKKKEMKEWGGLPGKSSRHPDPNVNWSGIIGTSAQQIHHYLRDVEFYTNLADAVDNFCLIYKDATPDELRELIKIRVCANLDTDNMSYSIDEYEENAINYSQMVGKFKIVPSVLFYAWKKYGGENKWKLGVKEFTKAVYKKLLDNREII